MSVLHIVVMHVTNKTLKLVNSFLLSPHHVSSLDRYNGVWLIFFMLGLGTLLPWNFFMTATMVTLLHPIICLIIPLDWFGHNRPEMTTKTIITS